MLEGTGLFDVELLDFGAAGRVRGSAIIRRGRADFCIIDMPLSERKGHACVRFKKLRAGVFGEGPDIEGRWPEENRDSDDACREPSRHQATRATVGALLQIRSKDQDFLQHKTLFQCFRSVNMGKLILTHT